MKYDILFSNQFKRSYKRCIKRGYNKTLFEKVITILSESGTLPPRDKPHKLTGKSNTQKFFLFLSTPATLA